MADGLVVAACRRLKEAGYIIALDDFAVNDPREALTDLADIIKVDLRATFPSDAAAMVKRYGPGRCRKTWRRGKNLAPQRMPGFYTFKDIFFAGRKP